MLEEFPQQCLAKREEELQDSRRNPRNHRDLRNRFSSKFFLAIEWFMMWMRIAFVVRIEFLDVQEIDWESEEFLMRNLLRTLEDQWGAQKLRFGLKKFLNFKEFLFSHLRHLSDVWIFAKSEQKSSSALLMQTSRSLTQELKQRHRSWQG